ncbi:MAG TPA: RidA family protein [Longimicrobiaceae bacterium]|nr:RidA family protein [Longimicrobiaceae bacterium]
MRNLTAMLALLLLSAVAGAEPLAGQDTEPRFIGSTNPNSVLSRVVVAGNTVYLSGVLGTSAGPGVQEQTRQVMETIRDSLAEVGASMDDVVKCTVFMADLSERPQMNEVYRSFFPMNRPARSAVGVDLGGPRVEIECIAILPER